jgi:predicted SprT family Zn-dependent metalloprotease
MFKNGNEVLPEFGNAEQISAIKKHQQLLESIENGQVLDIDFEEKITASFRIKCKCGSNVYYDDEFEDEYEFERAIAGHKMKCRQCDTKFIISKNEDNDLVAKIQK